MRRLFVSLTALGLVGAVVGCNHTCGVCDCNQVEYGCGYGAHNYPTGPAPVVQHQMAYEVAPVPVEVAPAPVPKTAVPALPGK